MKSIRGFGEYMKIQRLPVKPKCIFSYFKQYINISNKYNNEFMFHRKDEFPYDMNA